MNRVAIDGGGWFDLDAAEVWEGDSYWDGRNHIQVSTGDQWTGQDLIRTKSGNWVLFHWTRWQGVRNYYERISPAEAAEWFATNELDPPAALTEAHAALEV